MKTIKTGVIGVGYLGNFHAQKYHFLPQSQLVGVCDNNKDQANQVAQQCNTQAFYDYHDLLDHVQAVSIAVPTPKHFEVAKTCLERGIHVLVEKPICTRIEDANQLIAIAKRKNVILQVGHLERFNNGIRAIAPNIKKPRFIESIRLAPFKLRGTDVNVALDLMIHDIDIIHSLVHKNIDSISANGASVLSDFIDIANARIEFNGGCVANVTASRISLKTERRIRIFQDNGYLSLDLDKKKLYMHKKSKDEMYPGVPKIISEEHSFDTGDALKDQIDSFLNCILHDTAPVVSGEDGRDALRVAVEITDIMRQKNRQYSGDELGRLPYGDPE